MPPYSQRIEERSTPARQTDTVAFDGRQSAEAWTAGLQVADPANKFQRRRTGLRRVQNATNSPPATGNPGKAPIVYINTTTARRAVTARRSTIQMLGARNRCP